MNNPSVGAWSVLRRALATSADLRRTVRLTVCFAVVAAIGQLTLPILLRLVIDRAIIDGYRPTFVRNASLVAVGVAAVVYLTRRAALLRLTKSAEHTLYQLRMSVFEHLGRLSLATHNESRRGAWLAHVTSDIEAIERFLEWGLVQSMVAAAVVAGLTVAIAVFSWQLAAVTFIALLASVPVLRSIQARQLQAYIDVRDSVGDALAEVSESVMGAGTVRAYGIEARMRARAHGAIRKRYLAQLGAARWMALVFTVGDMFSAFALAGVVAVGTWYGPGWGVSVGELVAVMFLVLLVANPINELGEVMDQAQLAVAGYRQVFAALDQPIDIVEPDPGEALPSGALGIVVEGLSFDYGDGLPVLIDVNFAIPPGAAVAVVGETGSGKSTLAKMLVRFADPLAGRILVGGVDMTQIAPEARRAAIRLVPQDGFLFDTTVRENVRLGREDSTDAEIDAAFDALALGWWVRQLPSGLDTEVGERGEQLSVGERQLVALARAQLADPSILVLDEATSSVDTKTDRAVTTAMATLALGRTTVTIAHRMATAEMADLILVFAEGRLVEAGSHGELVANNGVYGGLFASWLGNTVEHPIDAEGTRHA